MGFPGSEICWQGGKLAYVLPLAVLSARVGPPNLDSNDSCQFRSVELTAGNGNPRPMGHGISFHGSGLEVESYGDRRAR
jgi:hypothetical protein